jgi:hypothetical protein
MTDKDKSYKRGDEYQFPADEYVSSEDTQDDSQAFQGRQDQDAPSQTSECEATEGSASQSGSVLDRFPILRNKRLLTVVGVSVVALIAFNIMTPQNHVEVVKRAAPAQPSLVQQQQQTLMNKLNGVAMNTANNQATVGQLQNQVKQLKTSLSQSNDSNESMKAAVIILAKQVQGLSTELKKATTAPRHIKKLPPAPELVFNLRAVTSGRAWVSGSNGESDTVTVGSHLKDYGTIKAIDSDAGKVITSSGKTITYNANGN